MAQLVTAEYNVELGGPIPAHLITAISMVEAAKNGFEYVPHSDQQSWVLIKRQKQLETRVNSNGKNSPELRQFIEILHLKPGEDRYQVIMASGVPDPMKSPLPPSAEIRFTPRSTMQALFYLAKGVDVPPSIWRPAWCVSRWVGWTRLRRRKAFFTSGHARVPSIDLRPVRTSLYGIEVIGSTLRTMTWRARQRSFSCRSFASSISSARS